MGIFNPDDQLHAIARAASKALGNTQIVTSEFVLAEFMNAYAKGGEEIKKKAAITVRRIIEVQDCDVIRSSLGLFDLALSKYERYADKDWIFVDCTSFCIMEEQRISHALAHDRHFEQAGFVALLRDNNWEKLATDQP